MLCHCGHPADQQVVRTAQALSKTAHCHTWTPAQLPRQQSTLVSPSQACCRPAAVSTAKCKGAEQQVVQGEEWPKNSSAALTQLPWQRQMSACSSRHSTGGAAEMYSGGAQNGGELRHHAKDEISCSEHCVVPRWGKGEVRLHQGAYLSDSAGAAALAGADLLRPCPGLSLRGLRGFGLPTLAGC